MDDGENSSFLRVLSIQSHVVSGYVGNKSACFPLQVLGFEVDFINSVQLSNHTGYAHIKGERLDSKHLEEIYDGLKLNGLTSYTHILTGYVGTETFLNKLVDIVKELKTMDPSIFFVCDPVMGDNNKLYVPEELLPIYRDHIIPLSDLITPNQFETELLTGVSIKSKSDVLEAMNLFHSKGIQHVVLSSVQIGSANELELFGSSMTGETKSIFTMKMPKLSSDFTGTGDLFSALLLAWMARTNNNLKVSCEKTVNTVHSVLLRTLKFASDTKDPKSPHSLELKLIQSKKDIENPPDILKCETLDI